MFISFGYILNALQNAYETLVNVCSEFKQKASLSVKPPSDCCFFQSTTSKDVIQKQIQASHDFQGDVQEPWETESCIFNMATAGSRGQTFQPCQTFKPWDCMRQANYFLFAAPYPSFWSTYTQFNEAALKCLLYPIEFLLIGGLEGQRWQHYLVIWSFLCHPLTGNICAF